MLETFYRRTTRAFLIQETFLRGLWQLGFGPIVICHLCHPKLEAAPSLSYGVDPYFGSPYFALGGYLFTHINRLGYQYSFI